MTMTQGCEELEQSGMNEVLGTIVELNTGVDNTLSRLKEKLFPVLLPEREEDEGKTGNKNGIRETKSPLAEDCIRELNGIRHNLIVISSLIDRIDL